MRFVVYLAAVAGAAGACTPKPDLSSPCYDPALDPGPAPRRAIPPGPRFEEEPCQGNGSCGGNSPVIDGIYFERLHRLGTFPNAEGVQILGVKSPGGVPMQLELVNKVGQHAEDGDRLRGLDLAGQAVIAEHNQLEGTQIKVSVKGAQYMIFIRKVHWTDGVPFWVGDKRLIETYEFRYSLIAGDGTTHADLPLCSGADKGLISAIVFGGDLYDPVTMNITTGPPTYGWLNIACAESAIYKMHRIGYTEAAQPGITTSHPQRQAMLFAWTADVCGDGASFTEQGEQITLREKVFEFNVWPYNDDPISYEAIWNGQGAVCLNVPRRYEDNANLCTALKKHCNRPPCDAAMIAQWWLYGDVLTGNRPDP